MRKLLIASLSVVILLLSCLAYVVAGSANSHTVVHYEMRIDEKDIPWMTVEMTLAPGKAGFIDLFMRETTINGLPRIKDLSITQNGRTVASWNLVPRLADIRRIWLGMSKRPLTITYSVNPLFYKGSAPRSYLGEHFGYLRGMATLFTPFTLKDIRAMLQNSDCVGLHAGTASVSTALPTGWSLSGPWQEGETMPIAAMRNTYMGVGPFDRANVLDGGLSVAVFTGLDEGVLNLLPKAYGELLRIFGMPPSSSASGWAVTVLPDNPLYGGAAGVNSLISTANPQVLVHEMVHWWVGHTIAFKPDANWVQEGFTTYYEGRVLRDIGWWNSGAFADFLNRHSSQLYGQQGSRPFNLVQASERQLKSPNERDYNTVYSGGALVANYIEQELNLQGEALDNLWSILATHRGPISTQAFLAALESLGGKDLAQECSALVQGHRTIPLP